MPRTEIQNLRALLGEDTDEETLAEDTLFTDEEIQGFLENAPNLERAAFEGWRVKAARLSNLVDTTEGNSQKKFSQLMGHAQDMMKLYQRSAGGPTEGRSRVGRIRRPGVEW